ncbi:MAG TPA: GNAT family N-acetyltransferase [Longimicrobium sp.]|nr:GNAT family N-acetyltransferase [Longimicrobium sp.]
MIPFGDPIETGYEPGLPVRVSARLVIVDPAERLLLFHYHPPGRLPFWSAAQAQLAAGEDATDADVLAAVERTGLRAEPGPSLEGRSHVYALADGTRVRWIERYVLVPCAGGEPSAGFWTPEERQVIRAHRWWTMDEVWAAGDLIQPYFLPATLGEAVETVRRNVVVTAGPLRDLRWYARMPPDDTSLGMIDVVARDGGLGGLALVQEWAIAWRRRRTDRFLARPLRWSREHDVRNWCVLTARSGRRRLGGAVVAFDTPGLALLRGRRDRAVLWDLRHARRPDYVPGVDEALFRAAAAWARDRGCRWLISQTTAYDTDGPGFFLQRGCELGAIHRFAAPDEDDEPDDRENADDDFYEPRFLWYFDLRGPGDPDPSPGSAGAAVLPAAVEVPVREVAVTDGPLGEMDEYARIPIAFEVRSVLEVEARERGYEGLWMTERTLDEPWVKDYDQGEERPQRWAHRFDVSRWRVFEAWSAGRPAGGAVVAWDTPGVEMLEGRRDLAVLWDLRVAPGARGHGVGAALFRAAAAWARGQGCRWLKIETQTINVPACRFYARMGCELGTIDRFAYPGLPDEAQLIWYLDLAPRTREPSGES